MTLEQIAEAAYDKTTLTSGAVLWGQLDSTARAIFITRAGGIILAGQDLGQFILSFDPLPETQVDLLRQFWGICKALEPLFGWTV